MEVGGGGFWGPLPVPGALRSDSDRPTPIGLRHVESAERNVGMQLHQLHLALGAWRTAIN